MKKQERISRQTFEGHLSTHEVGAQSAAARNLLNSKQNCFNIFRKLYLIKTFRPDAVASKTFYAFLNDKMKQFSFGFMRVPCKRS